MQLRKHARFLYQPVLPLGKNGKLVTNSTEHWKVALQMAEEGTVLPKNDGTLPLKQGAKICLFNVGAGEFLFGGGGSGAVFTQHKITLTDALTDAAKRGEVEFFLLWQISTPASVRSSSSRPCPCIPRCP